jgi:aryl-alcohol dehydrogenase-like predicted oxidoreductase
MSHLTRRDFLRTSLAGTALAGAGGVTAWGQRRSHSDWVTLGNSGVKVTRLAFGTGTFNGQVQRDLGQDGFTRLVRHAYDHGVRFFDTAESYTGMAQMLGTALKGIPRDTYRLMTKYELNGSSDWQSRVDRFRRDFNSEYIDILLLHCVQRPSWPDDTKNLQDAFSGLKAKKVILAHGASVHGMQGLSQFPGNKWLDVALMRINHTGTRMDGEVSRVADHAKQVHAQGTGVLGMKLIGEGSFLQPEQREAAMQFVMKLGAVDAVNIGYKSIEEINEAIERMNRALNS